MLFIFLFVVEIYFTATVFLQSGLSIDSKKILFFHLKYSVRAQPVFVCICMLSSVYELK